MPERTVEQRLRAAVESSPSGLLMIDAEGMIVLVNREVERLFGYSREELLGRPVELLVPDKDKHEHPGFRARFYGNPRVRSMGAGRDLHGRRKDGTLVPVEIGLTPVATEEGLFVISSIVDISDRKRAEARFRAAVESSPNGMVMVDERGRIVLVNQEVERLFGYSRDELLGESIERLVPARFRRGHPEFRGAFFEDPSARSMGAGRELFGVRKDGVEVPVEIGLNPIQTEEGLFVLSSIVDITARRQAQEERRQLEEQLRQSQKLESLGQLAGGIAHDFNNLLGAVIGYAELVREAVTEPQVAADVDEVLRAAIRGRELVERILRFSRRQQTSLQPVDLAQSVTDATRLLRATLPASIVLRVNAGTEPRRVMADATSVHQVVMNLATNAAHAMPGGGVVEIGLAPFYARDSFVRAFPGLREGHYVSLSVSDTGHGMDEATRARAFEPFFTTKAPGSGSGLGLATVHGIVRDHGGAAWIESEVGRGTSVHCLFPAVEQEGAEVTPAASPGERGRGQRILYVDDEYALVDVARRRLTGLDYRVEGVADPRSALAMLQASPEVYDLLVTDYSMPQMNGLDLAREAKRVRPDLPVLLISGNLDTLTEEAAVAAGVTAVLRKPLNATTLAAAVHAALSRR